MKEESSMPKKLQTRSIPVVGMHCASCANIVGRQLKKLDGVTESRVSYAQEEATVTFDPTVVNISQMQESVAKAGYDLVDETSVQHEDELMSSHGEHDHREMLKKEALEKQHRLVWQLAPMTILTFVYMLYELLGRLVSLPMVFESEETVHWIMFVLATLTLAWGGKPYLIALFRLFTQRLANMDSLIGLGTVAAYLYSFFAKEMFYDVTIVVIGFITLGKYLELRARYQTGSAIRSLMALQPSVALLLNSDGSTQEVSVERIVVGDRVLVKPGGRIPVDGVVLTGTSAVDESMLTGESVPVEKMPESVVRTGTVNTAGALVIEVTVTGEGTVLARIIAQVKAAQNSQAPIEQLADRVSAVFVPVVLVLALATLIVWGLVGNWEMGLTSFVGILVVACPCALGLATPTAVVVGVGKAAEKGILVKNAEYLEKLAQVDTVLLDKTGTLTAGKPALHQLYLVEKSAVGVSPHLVWSTEEAEGKNGALPETKQPEKVRGIWAVLAALERNSEHPVAQALFDAASTFVKKAPEVNEFTVTPGRGVGGSVEGEEYLLGTPAWLKSLRIKDSQEVQEQLSNAGGSVVLLYQKGKGIIAAAVVTDTVREGAAAAVAELHQLGLSTTMLTGDSQTAAAQIAKQVKIGAYHAELLPEDKLAMIRQLQKQGKRVAMTGDGINDSPALAAADVGVAMGTGTDVAMDTAGITLVGGSISALPKSVLVARQTMGVVRQNLLWAFLYNVLAIPVAGGLLYPFLGIALNPAIAGAAMALSSVSVVLNSLRLKYIA